MRPIDCQFFGSQSSMKAEGQPREHPRVRLKGFLRWGEYGLLLIAALALSWCGIVCIDAFLYQTYENWSLERALKGESSSVAAVGQWLSLGLRRDRCSIKAESFTLAEKKIEGRGGMRTRPHGSAVDATLIGRIEIPHIGLSAIISEGIAAETLRRAVGHIPGTALPGEGGNVGLAGHRDTFFRKLQKIHPNDAITLTTVNGTYHFLVQSTQIVGPNDTGILEACSQPTLVTCYPFYFVGPAPKRFVVRARAIAL